MRISHRQLVKVKYWWFTSDDAISVVLTHKAVDSIVSFFVVLVLYFYVYLNRERFVAQNIR